MPLATGTRLGPYEIIALLGAGGMGEVYKATDTRLDRTVAIKILRQASANLRERFEREARVVAALQHPHICTLFDIGNHDGMDFLVMEYLEGQTLQCPLPLAKVLECGMQISDALGAAHQKGVTHRDLKPANVMITRTGAKLLDFGIAKLNDAKRPGPDDATLTQALTAGGTLIGTLPYMAPEQLEGKQADPRSDIWAFGALLHEMISGKRAFDGKTQAGLIAAILEHDPPAVNPPWMEKVIKRCLAKDPERRWQSAVDIKLELESIKEAPKAVPATEKRVASSRPWIAATAAALLLAAALAGVLLLEKPAQQPTIRFQVNPSEGESFADSIPRLSPDGRKLAYTAQVAGGKTQLRIRPLDAVNSQALPDTDGAVSAFWSPDSRYLAFTADNKLKRIDVTGGAPQILCEVAPLVRHGTWGRGEVILIRNGSGIAQIPAAGGVPVPIVFPNLDQGEATAGSPQFLPDGRRFLYIITGKDQGIYWGSLDSKNPKERNLILKGPNTVMFAPGTGSTGRLLFQRGRTLLAQPFHTGTMQLSGDPVPVVQSLAAIGPVATFSASDNGVLAYSTSLQSRNMQLTWFDRDGKAISTLGAPGRLHYPALSPEERRVVIPIGDWNESNNDLWIHDMYRGTATRLTFDPAYSSYPVWSPDGTRIAFYSNRGGKHGLYVKAASGAGADELILPSPNLMRLSDWSADGRRLVFAGMDPKTNLDLWTLDMDQRKPALFLQTEFNEDQGQLSPDGRWMAYISDESKGFQVYVRSFPPSGGRWQVSVDGGIQPRWRRDGKEMYFLAPGNKIMAVPVKTGATFEQGSPKELFTAAMTPPSLMLGYHYAVSGDGQRFLLNFRPDRELVAPITVVVNWW